MLQQLRLHTSIFKSINQEKQQMRNNNNNNNKNKNQQTTTTTVNLPRIGLNPGGGEPIGRDENEIVEAQMLLKDEWLQKGDADSRRANHNDSLRLKTRNEGQMRCAIQV